MKDAFVDTDLLENILHEDMMSEKLYQNQENILTFRKNHNNSADFIFPDMNQKNISKNII